ncbi:MAG: hypothetical protein IKF42_02890 [Mogibacterium sp.]|nr:hypothetical protein [Mogibacterium sp.]
MRKKILAMFLAVAMLAVMGPLEVFAWTEANGTDAQEAVEVQTPDAPAVQAAVVYYSNVTDTAADINWSAVEGAASYEVAYNDVKIVSVGNVTTYKIANLTPNTTYNVKVTAYNAANTTISGSEGTCTFTTTSAVPSNAPAPVEKFKSISSYLSVILSWKKAEDVDGYKIYWNNGKKDGVIEVDSDTAKYVFKISDIDREQKYTFDIVAVKNGVESAPVTIEDSAVQLMKLKVTLKVAKVLKNHDRPEGKYTIKLKAGTNIETCGFTNGKYVFQKKVGGKLRTFHVMRIAVRNQKVQYIGAYSKSKGWRIVKPKLAYSKEEAESFVNTLGVKSNTKHLIWVNQYTQRLYVFKGKKGKWQLIEQCYKDEDDGYPGWPVASGKPTSPTSTGLTNIKQRTPGGGGKVPFWNVTTWFSIHGNSPGPWGPLGWPKSGACCRNTTPHAKWIYQNTKMHTAVYVY